MPGEIGCWTPSAKPKRVDLDGSNNSVFGDANLNMSRETVQTSPLTDFRKEEREILTASVFPRAEQALEECLDVGFDDVKDKYKKVNCL